MNGLESLIAIIQALLILSEYQYLGGLPQRYELTHERARVKLD